MEGNLPFLPCFTLYLRAIFITSPRGAYIWRGNLTEGFLRCEFGGFIFGGLIFGILRYIAKMEETCIKTLLDCDRIQSQRRKVIVKMSST